MPGPAGGAFCCCATSRMLASMDCSRASWANWMDLNVLNCSSVMDDSLWLVMEENQGKACLTTSCMPPRRLLSAYARLADDSFVLGVVATNDIRERLGRAVSQFRS